MATDFNKNSIIVAGGFTPSSINTPLDIRTSIETLDDIYSIPMPYVGMMVYVKNTGKRYEVLSLKAKKVGPIVKEDMLVDEYREMVLYDESVEIFETDMLTVNSFGGISAGSDLNGMTTHEILAKLLFPYVAPEIPKVICSPNGGVFEKGNNQKVSNVLVIVNKKSELINKIEVLYGNNIVATLEDESIRNGGTFNCPVDVEVNSNSNLIVRVTDASNKSVSAQTNQFTFVYPYFCGVCEEDTLINSELILSLEKKIEEKGNKEINYTTNNQKMIMAYPMEYGVMSKIFDANNFDVTTTFNCEVIDITGLDGIQKQYYVYSNNASTVNNFAIKFSY